MIQITGQNAYIDIRRVKLELGSVSTLQNDPPQDYGEELRKCQRYFIRYNNQVLSSVGIANSSSEMSAYAIYQIPPMRVKPVAINFSGLYLNSGNHSGANSVAVTSVETPPQGGSGAYAGTISTSGGLTAGETSIIQIRGTGCYIEFDANLYRDYPSIIRAGGWNNYPKQEAKPDVERGSYRERNSW